MDSGVFFSLYLFIFFFVADSYCSFFNLPDHLFVTEGENRYKRKICSDYGLRHRLRSSDSD